MKNSRTLLISVLAAASAGVIIGMLIAPEKGEDFRKNILKSADEWKKKLAELMNEGGKQLKSLSAAVEDELAQVIETKGTKASKA